MRVRAPGAQVCDYGRLAVGPSGAADAAEFARTRLAAVRTDHERSRDAAPVVQHHPRRVVIELERLEPGPQLRDCTECRRLGQCPLHAQVLRDVAEVRLAGLGCVESECIARILRARGIPHHHSLIRAGVRLDRVPRPGRAQDPLRCARQRGHAEIHRIVLRRPRRGRLYERNPPACQSLVQHEQRRDAEPDHAAAHHDRVEIQAPAEAHGAGPVSGTPRASRGTRPAAPTLSRDIAALAGGKESKASSPTLRSPRTTPSGVPKRRTSPSVNATMRRRSSSRHAA